LVVGNERAIRHAPVLPDRPPSQAMTTSDDGSAEIGRRAMRRKAMKIGFVGLGQMGKPMAMNMLKSGDEVVVVDLDTRSFAEFEAKGARTSRDVTAIGDADIVFLSVPNGKVVKAVLTGEGGLLAGAKRGQIVVDTSTITYSETMEVARACSERGVVFLDAPISGMEKRAIEGTLTVMCGGERDVFDKVKPLLELIGDKILYMGGLGSGQLTKLINQLLFDINAAALAEVLPMAVKMGLDPDLVAEVINSGTGRSYASEFFLSRILADHWTDGYLMKHAYKDLVSGAHISADLCIPMPVLAAATATYQTALLRGHGDKDKGGMVQVFEELLGVRFRSSRQTT
jgi:3-hydroxyisobutyrate dehydrogenase-like beta-hydroxyacid dehydrogenase